MWHLTEQPGGHSSHDRHATDSAGRPWAGRSFDTNFFAGDSGEAPERLIEALRRFRAAELAQQDVLDAVREVRLLVPLVAHAGETGVDAHGRRFDKTQELSLVTVSAPDGRRVLPVFTSTDAMAAWNPAARPIPASARRAALAAAGEDTPLMVLDPTSATEFVFRRPMLKAIAEGTPWVHPSVASNIIAAFHESIAPLAAVRALRLSDGDPDARMAGPQLTVALGLVPDLTRTELDDVLSSVQRRWQTSDLIASEVDSLGVKLVEAR
ncbi:SseB family protein [Agreia pratensis]|uniref:SseB protein N-terminal domain-containing protein n=1 Tax=Agreia pratensis TaxID=150121 RepID=A0A1X7KZX5_9MICO|nr:SseB family protein [Agreia pratensis]MBF4633807.1 SseB family protein [Agreia pratensis]SMG46439.1 SseB protein N-terminal domain-containing protein [Agreia pratensis]